MLNLSTSDFILYQSKNECNEKLKGQPNKLIPSHRSWLQISILSAIKHDLSTQLFLIIAIRLVVLQFVKILFV